MQGVLLCALGLLGFSAVCPVDEALWPALAVLLEVPAGAGAGARGESVVTG